VLLAHFKKTGKVSGYDKTLALTKELIESGINIHFEDRIDLIQRNFILKTL
jgi:UDP-N-acetylmuramate--alanine ligase